MSRKALMIGALLAGVLVLLVVTLTVRRPADLSSVESGGLNAVDEVEGQEAIRASERETVDATGQPMNGAKDGTENPTMDRWGIPSEDMVQLSPDELGQIRSTRMTDAPQANAGLPQAGANSQLPMTNSTESLDSSGDFPDPSGPDASAPGVAGSSPEASDWGLAGSAPEAFDLGQPLTPPPESDAGEFGPGDLEDDPDSPPPEGY